jgi:predicted ATPase
MEVRVSLLRGRVVSGMGNFSYWIEKLQDYYLRKTGMRFFPGTLNVQLSHPWSVPNKALRLEAGEYGGTVSVNLVPCSIFGRRGFILRTDANETEEKHHPRTVVEVATDLKLRDYFHLNDGDSVEIEVPPAASIPRTGEDQGSNTGRFYILTGGPGSGKSTLLAALRGYGLHTMPEAGRAVIQEQVASGGNALPWRDRAVFAEQMFERDADSWRRAHALQGPVFFDRGVADVAGYLRLCGLSVPPQIVTAARTFSYNSQVFIAPPWAAIFARDAERKQTPEEAEATWRTMVEVYTELGYRLVPLPLASVAERVQFIFETIGFHPAPDPSGRSAPDPGHR